MLEATQANIRPPPPTLWCPQHTADTALPTQVTPRALLPQGHRADKVQTQRTWHITWPTHEDDAPSWCHLAPENLLQRAHWALLCPPMLWPGARGPTRRAVVRLRAGPEAREEVLTFDFSSSASKMELLGQGEGGGRILSAGSLGSCFMIPKT